jgi:uncharacterized phage protein (TIGR01671 family)
MREIVFRGKLAYNGVWVYGGFYKEPVDDIKDGKTYIITGSLSFAGNANQVIPETIGQYTGLVDKNGKMIFEGDIIHDEDSGAIGEVFFNNDGTGGYSTWFLGVGYNCALSVLDSTNLVIIGNIHDNPELVEAK